MSVLSVPRIYFQGVAEWNPATTNNNDQWPTYDLLNVDLNWNFLAQQNPPITKQNAQTEFPTWFLTSQTFSSNGASWQQPPCEWNYYGGNEARLHTTDPNNLTGLTTTNITGGQLAYGGPVQTGDELVGAVVKIVGSPFGDAREVDINPAAFWTTDVFVGSFGIRSA
ncbi:MAG: hypothetical protein M3347_02885 [Armatimonadota bacterium]|nr:hypothetical protein [Armatimonadota bacterium]